MMPKKNFWDNKSLQQDIKWDNQELPGVPDEILLTKDWSKSDQTKEFFKDKDFLKKYNKGIENRNQSENYKNSIKDRNKNKSYIEKLKNGIQKRIIDYSFTKTEQYKKKISESNSKLKEHPNYKEVRKNVGKKNSKPIMTPDGKFNSIKEAAIYYNKDTSQIHYWLKNKSDQYYYVEKEDK